MSLDDQPGLLLPHNVVQPFFLRYQPDDLHVIAFIAGHAAYEAVEAMIRHRAGGGADIRAIITRHDQSQVDHINSAAGMAQVRGAARDYRECDIAFTEETRSDSRRVRVAFASSAGENIDLEITTLGLPTTRASGLTDPGAHSVTSALPMMWRGASALGGPQTRIVIDGRRYEAPPGRPFPAQRPAGHSSQRDSRWACYAPAKPHCVSSAAPLLSVPALNGCTRTREKQ